MDAGMMMDPEFGKLIQQAIKLKGAQMEQQRRAFDSWPAFYQNTLFMSGAVLQLRELPVEERLKRARTLKDEGNERFRAQAFTAAIELYEQAAGAFRYARHTDPDWKQKGIRDEAIEEVDELGDPRTGTRSQAVSFVASCYNNLAAAYLARAALPRGDAAQLTNTSDADYALCVAACTAVLSLDPTATKALYRRARARVEPISAAEGATDAAIRDLCEAARHSPDDQAVRELLARLKRDRADKRQADSSTFARMFGRVAARAAPVALRSGVAGGAWSGGGAIGGLGSERRGAQAKGVRAVECSASCAVPDDAPETNATERRRRLGMYRRAEAARAKRGTPYIDFRNPTPKQREDARMRGIDLDDPLVLAELDRLQRQMPHDAQPTPARRRAGGARLVRHRSARPPPPDVHCIPLSEIRRRLGDLGVDLAGTPPDDRPMLEQLLLSQYDLSPSSSSRHLDVESSSSVSDEDRSGDEGGVAALGGLRAAVGEYCAIS